MATRVILVRHGQSEANAGDLFTGHGKFPLTSLGHMQAEKTAAYIQETYCVNALYSSDLPRAYQTAEHIANAIHLPVKTDSRFREINAGDWESRTFDALSEEDGEAFRIWRTDLGNARCTNGESVREVAERMVGAVKATAQAHPDQCIVIATHATPIRSVLWYLTGMNINQMRKLSWGSNCAVTELEYCDGELKLIGANYAQHLADCETKLPENV